ncbi:hypothetical protein [Saccharopolyspora rosea]|uniref:DUF3618 domain-containing protein n=1 Tax=Saccharopolyspora rosea TaxID=524884 RepID=A0ABW3FXI4_9PSEU|nr:hypothetical protein [Saccharopolyspora rosea]
MNAQQARHGRESPARLDAERELAREDTKRVLAELGHRADLPRRSRQAVRRGTDRCRHGLARTASQVRRLGTRPAALSAVGVVALAAVCAYLATRHRSHRC